MYLNTSYFYMTFGCDRSFFDVTRPPILRFPLIFYLIVGVIAMCLYCQPKIIRFHCRPRGCGFVVYNHAARLYMTIVILFPHCILPSSVFGVETSYELLPDFIEDNSCGMVTTDDSFTWTGGCALHFFGSVSPLSALTGHIIFVLTNNYIFLLRYVCPESGILLIVLTTF